MHKKSKCQYKIIRVCLCIIRGTILNGFLSTYITKSVKLCRVTIVDIYCYTLKQYNIKDTLNTDYELLRFKFKLTVLFNLSKYTLNGWLASDIFCIRRPGVACRVPFAREGTSLTTVRWEFLSKKYYITYLDECRDAIRKTFSGVMYSLISSVRKVPTSRTYTIQISNTRIEQLYNNIYTYNNNYINNYRFN